MEQILELDVEVKDGGNKETRDRKKRMEDMVLIRVGNEVERRILENKRS